MRIHCRDDLESLIGRIQALLLRRLVRPHSRLRLLEVLLLDHWVPCRHHIHYRVLAIGLALASFELLHDLELVVVCCILISYLLGQCALAAT